MTDVVLLFVLAGLICVTVGGLGLYFTTKKRIEDIEEALIAYDRDITNNKREIRKLDRKLDQQCDRVIIYHKNDDSDLKYPNQEGLS
jgi:3-keto-L-gulonate-6-phosphate decarboxylase